MGYRTDGRADEHSMWKKGGRAERKGLLGHYPLGVFKPEGGRRGKGVWVEELEASETWGPRGARGHVSVSSTQSSQQVKDDVIRRTISIKSMSSELRAK